MRSADHKSSYLSPVLHLTPKTGFLLRTEAPSMTLNGVIFPLSSLFFASELDQLAGAHSMTFTAVCLLLTKFMSLCSQCQKQWKLWC